MMATPMFFMAGAWEILIMLMLGGGSMVPAGVPPLPEDPVLMQVAPQQAMLFVEWFGCGEADGESKNATERLAANPEIKALIGTVKKAIESGIRNEMRGEERMIAEDVMKLVLTLYARPGCLYFSDFRMGPEGVAVEAGIVVNAGKELDNIKRVLMKFEKLLLFEMSRGNPQQSAISQIGSATFRQLPLPPDAPPVAWGTQGQYVMLAIGQGTPNKIINNMTKGPGLTAYAPARKALATVKVARPNFRSYLNVAQIIEKFGPMAPPQVMEVIDALGLTGIQGLVSESGLEGDGFASKSMVLTTGELKGILRLAAAKPLTSKDLAVIPGDASIAMAVKLDVQDIYKTFLNILDRIEPRARMEFMDEVIHEPGRALGIDIEKDIIGSLGDTLCLWNAPSDGGLVFTGLTLSVDLADADRFQQALEKVMNFVQMQTGSAWEMGSRRARRGVYVSNFIYKGVKVYHINSVGEEIPIAPAWCVANGKVYASLFPQMLKTVLARGADASGSMAANPAFSNLDNVISASYMDFPRVFELLYPVLHPLAQLACDELQREGLNVTIAALPTAAGIQPHLKPEVSRVVRTQDGILITQRGAIPMGGGLGAGTVLSSMMLFGVSAPVYRSARVEMPMQADDVAVAEARPQPSRRPTPRGRAVQAKQMATLRHLGVALQMYRIEHGAFPDRLDALWTGKDKLINKPALDHAGKPFNYFGPKVKESREMVASTTAPLSGQRHVLFVDGSIMTVPEKEYQQLEAKQRPGQLKKAR